MTVLSLDANTHPIPYIRLGLSENIVVGVASVQGAVFDANTAAIRVVSDTNCFVSIGANPTAAAATSTRVVADVPETFSVKGGQRVAVIRETLDGNLNVTEGGVD